MDNSRLDDMVERYGECCNQAKAARILGVTARTVYRMMEDGRLRRVGTSVDVRSIAGYLENPKQCDFMARRRVPIKESKPGMWDNFAKN